MSQPECVLVAPLNWGLGHATRSIPIIRALLGRGTRVLLASDGEALSLLHNEFPELKCIELPGYRPHYSERNSVATALAGQLPKFYSSVKKEHEQLARIVRDERVDAVISDNRYGAWSDAVPCALVIHQLNLIMPAGLKWIGPLVNAFHRRMINRFDQVWVPDRADSMLSGRLSSIRRTKHTQFIGPLSRFKAMSDEPGCYELVAVLSGPEPQRSILEKILMDQLSACQLRSLVVRGVADSKPGGYQKINGIEVVDFLDTDGLHAVMSGAKVIVARPGYSTLMDLARIGKKAILIPTPGQTEQEYLGKLAMDNGYALTISQHEVRLDAALHRWEEYTGFPAVEADDTQLMNAINQLVQR